MGALFIGGAALVGALAIGYAAGGTLARTADLLLVGAVLVGVWLRWLVGILVGSTARRVRRG